jgi:hypothetical protein
MKTEKVNRAGTCVARTLKITLAGLAILVSAGLIETASAAQRPLSDFLSRQGTYCLSSLAPDGSLPFGSCGTYGSLGCGVLQVPPAPNYVNWTDPSSGASVTFDYAGLADGALGGVLGTTVSGSINEVPQNDGSAIVTVLLHTKNALAWANTGSAPQGGALLFGHRTTEVALSNAVPALGSCTLKVVIQISAPGAPLPDLIETFLAFGGPCGTSSFISISFNGQASGTLPDGTPASLQVTEVGLIRVAGIANPNSRVALDAFPAEHIDIQATGH